ncbi:MAG TPA: hypothetical protein VF688_08220 [Allosphingosinicella sp.]|jgi:hypothetical protein
MRTLIRLLALGTAAAAVPVCAALPPQYQRLAELQAVLEADGVADAFAGAPIDRVQYVRPDLYRVSAGRCHVDVAIVGIPETSGVAGPRRFGMKAGRKTCGR